MLRCILLFAIFVTGLLRPVLSQSGRSQIIYIMEDDPAYADLRCYGRKDYQTPHLDKLVKEGVTGSFLRLIKVKLRIDMNHPLRGIPDLISKV